MAVVTGSNIGTTSRRVRGFIENPPVNVGQPTGVPRLGRPRITLSNDCSHSARASMLKNATSMAQRIMICGECV